MCILNQFCLIFILCIQYFTKTYKRENLNNGFNKLTKGETIHALTQPLIQVYALKTDICISLILGI